MKNRLLLVVLVVVGVVVMIVLNRDSGDVFLEIEHTQNLNLNPNIDYNNFIKPQPILHESVHKLTHSSKIMDNTQLPIEPSSLIKNPIRTVKDKIIAFQKFINGTGKMIIFHHSQTSESTINNFMDSIRSKLLTLHRNDNYDWNSLIETYAITNTFHEDFGTSISHKLSNEPHNIYVICYSDPINRILAQYDKEWRWGACKDGCDSSSNAFMAEYNHSKLNANNYLSLSSSNPSISPLERYAAIDFNDFLYRIVKFEIEKQSTNAQLFQMYLNDYYLWALCCNNERCNIVKDFVMPEGKQNIAICRENAKQIIKSFDLVFIKEWIQDLRVQFYVNELFFKENNINDQKNKFIALPSHTYVVSDQGTNYMYDPDNEQLLNALNEYDYPFYEWVRDLVFNRTHIIWERAKYNKNHRNEFIYDLGMEHIITHSQSDT